MLQPSFAGQVRVETNAQQDVVIHVNDKEFIADLMFMNQFAVCGACDAIKAWEYYFPKDSATPTS